MRTLARIVGVVIAVVALLVVIAFFLPRTVTVERQTDIAATPDVVFTKINDLRAFSEWSPWSGRDPQMTQAFEGPDRGPGQIMRWTSAEMGDGSMTITAAEADKKVETVLDFGPMGTAFSWFDLSPVGDATTVTWGFRTDLGTNPIARWMGLTMDGMVGSDYEEGLATLKAKVESAPAN
ncbi:MAG: SRPBCC family protein [Pseudomonadota bacterium]